MSGDDPSPTDNLDELFSKDPLELTNDEVETIVKVLRSKRLLWAVQEKEKQDKPKKEKKAKPQGTLDLGELEIEI